MDILAGPTGCSATLFLAAQAQDNDRVIGFIDNIWQLFLEKGCGDVEEAAVGK